MTAVRAMLDEKHEPLKSQDTHDNNSYVLGRMGQHNVVIACLPAGVYGTTSAATVAGNMLRTFTGLRFGLLVGIGGGIPNIPASRDIRLGDIVVSQPEDYFGGVVQYDLGKNMGEGRFERKGYLNSFPTFLLTAMASLRSDSDLEESQVPQHLMKMNDKYPRLKSQGYVFPGRENDTLYCPQCGGSSSSGPCNFKECSNGKILRPPRNDGNPVIHYGTIASGNQVIKDAKERDQLGRELKAVCVEMEAAGLMNNFPCIVVRGICDYADSHKNDAWQKYAAGAAAAYAKCFLGYVPPRQTANGERIQDLVGMLAERALKEETRHRRNCHQAFKTSTYEEFKDFNPPRVDGTCQWVLSHFHYRQWYDEPHDNLLWISADPGCGKSVLAKSLVDNELRNTEEHTLCYFFFKDNEAQNNVVTALCALLHQLFSHKPQLIQHAIPAWKNNGYKLVKEVPELWRILLAAAMDDRAHDVTCVLDALDECQPSYQRWLIEMLSQFHYQISSSSPTTRRGRLKFLVTSRPYDNIQAEFQKTLYDLPTIRLRGEEENDSIHEEIDLVIRMRVKKLATHKKLDDITKDQLMTQLLGMQHRTYLWLHLAIDSIYQTFHDCLRLEEASIESLPSTVEEAYEKILARVTQEQKDTVKKILQIVVGAHRALTIQEMAIALGIATSAQPKSLDQAKLDHSRLEDNIRDWCGLFIFINHARIYLIHQTAKEFLIGNSCSTPLPGWKHCLDPGEIEIEMARICGEFLCLEDTRHVGESLAPRYRRRHEVLEKYNDVESLWVYSAVYWPNHLRNAVEPMNENTISQLYDTDGSLYDSWFTIFWEAIDRSYEGQPEKMNSIRLAALLGHRKVLRSILQSNGQYEINKPDERGRTALYHASQNGDEKVVQILVDAGADVNAEGEGCFSALHVASEGGYEKIVQILVDKGADVNALTGGKSLELYSSPLGVASAGGHEKIVQILVDAGADVNTEGDYCSALYVASEAGYEKVVQILVNAGADVIARRGGYYCNALCIASERGSEKIVQILLDRGVDINTLGGDEGVEGRRSPLCVALKRGYEKIVQILLDRGADVNVFDDYGTALSAASEYGNEKIVQMLVDRGADVNALGHYGTALSVASAGGYEKIVQFLVDRGADVNALGDYGTALFAASPYSKEKTYYGTALSAASAYGKEKIVQMLLDRGADVNALGKNTSSTALDVASKGGHEKVVQILVDRGADVNALGKDGTALSLASKGGHEKIVQILLNAGADVNIPTDSVHGSPLYMASKGGHEKVVQMLVDRGADVNALGKDGTTLDVASRGGHEKIVQILVDRGADVNVLGNDGTALDVARSYGREKIVQILLAAGADVNAQGGNNAAATLAS
ncbi:hypothetical protein LTR47_001484 [Exophiala xenobiotica]|nr:hypothetical protein LTR41_003376 [Exophiala xenobiotica]KAK5237218.1 hypothetical protein LTR47_001484 [Exophiala xenobiotica]KAK5242233.1 hypothetical protein LTS06_011650 [Exophiala xenobiotica]KAK5259467.1 hypothetical protein LTR40_005938 [Exophiala xenobiotica]KAK5354903.1 hypothetical protein LTR61_002203 [Exophiala xenobiotica]